MTAVFILPAGSAAGETGIFGPPGAVTLEPPAPVVKGLDGFGQTGLDDRRTLSRFGANLVHGAKGVMGRDNLVPLAVGTALFAGTSLLDDSAQSMLASRFPDAGNAGARMGSLSVVAGVTAGLFVVGQASGGRLKAATYDVAQAALINGAYTFALKSLAGRTRPDGSDRLSFPSGHTSNAFATATVLHRHYGAKVGVPAFALAGFVGLSRVERDRHHLSDVAFGAALGVLVGRTVVRVNSSPLDDRAGFELRLAPSTDLRGTGAGLALSASF
ncbi:MAG TPA: phosphatase PAP2 family protein [Vicinamibacteria bacterium]